MKMKMKMIKGLHKKHINRPRRRHIHNGSRTIAPEENCPFTIKFPPEIIAPTQTKSPQRVVRVN